jgi:hypothetical protein
MADDDKIVIPIELEVDQASAEAVADSVQRSIDAAAKRVNITSEEFTKRHDEGVAAKKKTEEEGGSSKPPNLEKAVLGETNEEVGLSAEAVRLFREALHVLHPALAEAGIGVGEMTGLVRAATGGIIALASAIGGVLVTALEKAGDEANDAARRLSAFTGGGVEGGKKAFESLEDVGKQTGVPATALAAPYEQLLRSNQDLVKEQQSTEKELSVALTNLIKGAIGENPNDQAKAIKAVETFIAENKKSGTSPESLERFGDTAPKTAAALARNLPPDAGTRDLIQAATAAAPEIEKALKDSATLAEGVGQGWSAVKTASTKLEEALFIGPVIAKTLEGFASFLDNLAEGVKGFKSDYGVGTGPDKDNAAVTKTFSSALTEQGEGGLAPGQESIDGLSESAKAAAEALEKVKENGESAGVTLKNYADSQDLKKLSTEASFLKTAIDTAFEPLESKNKLAKEEIAVQNADLHIQTAEIAGIEAGKNEALAALAPGQAHQSVLSAQDQLAAASLAERKNELGITGPTVQDAELRRSQLQHSRQAAEAALKRAKIEEDYAYLEPEKAKLAAEKTKTDIRSAEEEQKSAQLTFAKGKAGEPISHELQQLKYSEEVLKHNKLIEKTSDAQLEALHKIVDNTAKGAKDNIPNSARNAVGGETGTETAREVTPGASSSSTGPSYRTDENGDRVNTTLADVHHFNQQQAAAREAEAARSLPVTGVQDTTEEHRPLPISNVQDTTEQYKAQALESKSPDLGETVQPLLDALTSKISETLDNLSSKLSGPSKEDLDQSNSPASTLGIRGEADTTGEEVGTKVASAGDTLVDAILGIAEKLRGSDGDVAHAAGGGHIQGPGTGTSDSIPAMLSAGEFVHTAAATDHYGLNFMHAINTMQLPKFADGGEVEDDDGSDSPRRKKKKNQPFFGLFDSPWHSDSAFKFARGGLARHFNAPVIHMAGGGSVAADSPTRSEPLSYHSVDLRTDHGDITGLMAPEQTLNSLRSAAVAKQTVSTGKSPGWRGGR